MEKDNSCLVRNFIIDGYRVRRQPLMGRIYLSDQEMEGKVNRIHFREDVTDPF